MLKRDIKPAGRELQTGFCGNLFGGLLEKITKEDDFVVQRKKKIELNYCLACHLLDNCRKNKGWQLTRTCHEGKCDFFADCEDKNKFATLQMALDYFQKNPSGRSFYDVHVSLTCNECRKKEED